MIVAVVAASIAEGGWLVGGAVELGVSVVPLIAFQRSHHKTVVVTSIGASTLTGWTVTPLVLAGLAATLAIFTLVTGRLPQQWHPLPKPSMLRHPLEAVRCRRCDRRITRSDIIGARRALGSHTGPWLRFRSVFLDLEERLYQSALSLGSDPGLPDTLLAPAKLLQGRALSATARFAEADAAYREVLHSRQDTNDRLYDYLVLLVAENDLAAGHGEQAVQNAIWLTTRAAGTSDYFMRQRAMRLIAEHELDQGRVDRAALLTERAMDDLLRNRAVARLTLASQPHRLVRRLYGSHGSMYLHMLRVDKLSRATASVGPPTNANRDPWDGWEWQPVAMAMAITRAADDLVELYLSEARTAASSNRRAEALPMIACALMELDRTRYLLAAQSTRSSWSKRFRRVLDFALAVAHAEQDHEFVAELIEFARVQTLPAVTAEGLTNELGNLDLSLSTPPVVLVNGRSRLARPGERQRPAHVDLEHAAERAAGADAWWLSYWSSEDWLYWALIDPHGKTTTGRMDFGADSPLQQCLDELERALPALLPGEQQAEADFRIAASPLLTDPAAELGLSAALGNLLLPRRLVRAATDTCANGRRRLPLAIAPVAALGCLPWGLLVADDQPSSCPDRLVDLCDWVLAPSAALVCNSVVGQFNRAPLTLAVVDTIDHPELVALPEAREQAAALPGSVHVLGGRHWSSEPATLLRLEQALRAVGPDSTVAFFCHAVRGSIDEPSMGGLVLASESSRPTTGPESSVQSAVDNTPPEPYDVLTPSHIFAMSRRGLKMPAQILLQACDTSALKDVTSGEWLTIAPAFIATGSREVIATVYPLADLPGTDDPVMRAALNGNSLQEAVSRLQREGLRRWNSGNITDLSDTPFAWAAYATVAVQPSARMNSAAQKPFRRSVSDTFMHVVGDAISSCLNTRAKRLDSGWLLASLLDSEMIGELLGGATISLLPSTLTWTLGPYLCTRYARMRDRGPTTRLHVGNNVLHVPYKVTEALQTAWSAAERDGLPLTPHHLVAALLAGPTGASRILGLLAALSRQRRVLVHRAIEFELTAHISGRLTRWTKSPQAHRYGDIIEALLAHHVVRPGGVSPVNGCGSADRDL
ncbi:CHAT domain-containing protein [Streptacidiphilus sp. N1-3]|uniref:CHAT domain-containing protein n=1 Tax=Streptacidiphilus alkalitolerans TaxID=3342712 RepID=A0ABV6WX48_9ACTN